MYQGLDAQLGKPHCSFFFFLIILKYFSVSEGHYFKFLLLATQVFLETDMQQKSNF